MTSIRKDLAEQGLFPKKRWGQHFLVDRNIIRKIVQTAEIRSEDILLEVGPGPGALTVALEARAKKVIAVEIDTGLAGILKKKLGSSSGVELITGDALSIDYEQLAQKEGAPLKVVANLPYQISTPLLFRFLDSRKAFTTLTVMVQKEVAERMVAPPGGKEYGPLSIQMQLVADLSISFRVKPSCFIPPPKVDSAVVHLTWKKQPLVAAPHESWFKQVVKGCFCYRRKTLMNALRQSGLPLPEDAGARMTSAGIDPRRRPETLTLQEFVRLAEVLKT
jgi:16S rRNA (adenine1518-N6/adenine1519-N6)-dimethyltransferase